MVGHPLMGFRLVILAAMGLGALYMFHLLAQDYNKIRQPIAQLRSLLRFKRELSDGKNSDDRFAIDWARILKYDPMNCLPSLACQLFSGAEPRSEEGKNIKFLLLHSLKKSPPKQIVTAIKNGLGFEGESQKCLKKYSYCIYTASGMLRILGLFTKYFE